MAILAECPACRNKQSVKNKLCKCGESLEKAKKSKRVKYWIQYRFPNGKQRKESLAKCKELNPYSIDDARIAQSKRITQKRENRMFEMLPGATISCGELVDGYLKRREVKKLMSYDRVQGILNMFKKNFETTMANDLKPEKLQNYLHEREDEGRSPATVDMERTYILAMVSWGADNDMVEDRVLRKLKSVKRRLEKGSNARDRVLGVEDYLKLINEGTTYLQAMVKIAYNTGMRYGEIKELKWSYIDGDMIRFPLGLTKEGRKRKVSEEDPRRKNIPINHHAKETLRRIPRKLRNDYVFTYRGNPLKRSTKKGLKSACEDAGIEYGVGTDKGITFRDFRTSFSTNWTNAGANEIHGSIIMGHSLKGMGDWYKKPSDEDLRKSMDQFTNWLDKEVERIQAGNVTHVLPK
jgi:integrase